MCIRKLVIHLAALALFLIIQACRFTGGGSTESALRCTVSETSGGEDSSTVIINSAGGSNNSVISSIGFTQGIDTRDIVNAPSSESPSMMRITPFDSHSSYLYHKIKGTHTYVGGFGKIMPPDRIFPLRDGEIASIKEWIDAQARRRRAYRSTATGSLAWRGNR